MNRKHFLTLAAALLSLSLAACEKPADKEARYLRQGNALFEKGDYVKARLEYKNAEQIMPTDAEPRYRLGLVDEAENDPRNAFANFASAEQQNPHHHPTLLKLAQYLIAAGAYDLADHRLNTVLTETPDDAQGLALRASILLRQKDYDGTEKEVRKALAKDPANITAIAVLAGLYSAEKDEPKAVAALDDGIARNPQDLSLLILKVMIYEQSSNLEKTAEAYQQVFKLKPQEEVFRNDLAKIYLKAGKPDEAEATLRAGVAAMPEDWEMKKDLVMFIGENRGLDVAEKEIRDLMKAYPKNDELYFWLADLYITHNAMDRAVSLLEQVIAQDQSANIGLSARNSLARIQFVKGNRELAQKLVTAVLEKDSANPDALLIRAQMNYDMGHYQDAVSDLRTIIRDNPHAGVAIQLLSETFLLQGRVDLAIDTLNQLLDFDPINTAAQVRLAQMYGINGNTKKAMELLADVTKEVPNYPVGWESTARIAISMKDWGTAQDAITKLDALEGQHMTATYLKGEVLAGTGKPQDALNLYIEVIHADPLSPLSEHAFSGLVEVDNSQNKLADAVTTIGSLRVDSPFISTLLGGCLQKLGRMPEAAAAFDKAISEHSTVPTPYIGRAQLYIKEGKKEDAAAILKRGREIAPSDVRLNMLYANVLSRLGKYQEAMALYDDILTHNPAIDDAANDLAEVIADYLYNDSAALEKARQTAERFIRSENPFYLDTLGWVYYRQGNVQQALTVMQRVMASKVPLPAEVHYHYGSLLLKLGKNDEAKTELTQAVTPGADYPGLEEAKKSLEGL